MSTIATVMGSNGCPLSEDFTVVDDDFSSVEQVAAQVAGSGTSCCIRWHRESDGQVAYWSPSGATLSPHWYAS